MSDWTHVVHIIASTMSFGACITLLRGLREVSRRLESLDDRHGHLAHRVDHVTGYAEGLNEAQKRMNERVAEMSMTRGGPYR